MTLPFTLRTIFLSLSLAGPILATPYKKLDQVDGAVLMLSSAESSHGAALLQAAFTKIYPTVKTAIERPTSRSEANALLNGFANLVLTDKKITPEYRQYFLDRHGVLPTSLLAYRTKDGKEVTLGTLIYMPGDLDTVLREFITFLYSDDGTKIIESSGFKPLSAEEKSSQLEKLTQRGPSK